MDAAPIRRTRSASYGLFRNKNPSPTPQFGTRLSLDRRASASRPLRVLHLRLPAARDRQEACSLSEHCVLSGLRADMRPNLGTQAASLSLLEAERCESR